jgi:starch phosphorylase
MNNGKSFNCSPLTTETEAFKSLTSLALDMRWSWNHTADELWQQLAPALWEQTHSPWLVLQTVSEEQLQRQLASPSFCAKLNSLVRLREDDDSEAGWFKTTHPETPLKTVAYFSMEFMLSEALPIYVGGLGNVAGDQLKSASDLGVPVVAVGLLYQQGYFRQYIDEYGDQQAYKPYNDPGQLPISPLRTPGGEWVRVAIHLRGQPLWLRAWQVQTGRVKLYLLDSNDAANLPDQRAITSEIYGGGQEMRIQQEIILGIGGWRLLEQLGISPEVCHLNEGHAAFAVLERAHHYMKKTGENFGTALAVTRAGNLFTTHTAVAAGFDHFDPSLIAKYLGHYAEKNLNLSLHDLLALGRQNPDNPNESFNMAYLAVHGSGGINGVSKLHGKVSRHLFEPLFDRWPTEEVPVAHVTNGVHMPSWESEAADQLWSEVTPAGRWKGTTESFEKSIQTLSDEKIWNMRNTARAAFVDYVRQRSATMLAAYGASQELIDKTATLFDPNVLTLGFARRFVPYKRTDLLLQDPDRLVRLLTNHQQPVQLVIAGKAPPADEGGKYLIKRWIQFIQRTGLSHHVLFMSDYDMLMAAHLVGGVDVWLNTPLRPWEASGTSGMKVLPNGGLNLSELDGWWVEAYQPEVGWALGDGLEHYNDPDLDRRDAEDLYRILEQEVIPGYYQRNGGGIPTSWVNRIRKSMSSLTPYFSSNRTVREYTEKYYIPAATEFHARAAYNSALGKKIVEWKEGMDKSWQNLRFGRLVSMTENDFYAFEVQVFLDGIDPDSVAVELFAGAVNDGDVFRIEMSPIDKPADKEALEKGSVKYGVKIPANRAIGEYTPRIVPKNNALSIPLEYDRIVWQH